MPTRNSVLSSACGLREFRKGRLASLSLALVRAYPEGCAGFSGCHLSRAYRPTGLGSEERERQSMLRGLKPQPRRKGVVC